MPSNDYFRRDQSGGITAPDLTKVCSPSDHIVRARGKRTNFTSVSLSRDRIEVFGESTYLLRRAKLTRDKHVLIEHGHLLGMLRETCRTKDKHERARALRALGYARIRAEGPVDWRFDTSRLQPSEVITWTWSHVQPYFKKV